MDNILKPHLRQNRRHRNPRFAKSSELKIDVERGCIIIHEKCGGRIAKTGSLPHRQLVLSNQGIGPVKAIFYFKKRNLKNITITGWDRLENLVSAEDSGL